VNHQDAGARARERGDDTRADILALLRPGLWEDVCRIAGRHGVHVELARDSALFVARVEAEEPRAVLIDAGVTAAVGPLQRFVRSLWPHTTIIVAVGSWSDAEAALGRDADAVIHVPLREPEWSAAIVRALSGDDG